MAHITEFFIEGLLGRSKPITFELNRDVNIFFGENGCGKTTLLKVLDAALSRDGAAMERLPVTKAVVDIYSISENKVIRHTWDRRSGGEEDKYTIHQLALLEKEYPDVDPRYIYRSSSSKNEWKLTPARKKNSPPSPWQHTFLPTTRLYFDELFPGRATPGRSQLSEKELDQAFSDSVNRAWLKFYSRTLNEVRSIQEFGLRAVLRHVLNPTQAPKQDPSRDSAAVYTRVANFLARQQHTEIITLGSKANFKKRYEEDLNLRSIVDNLDDVESNIEQSMAPINRFIDTISQLFSRGKKINLADNEIRVLLADGRTLPIAQLSSGEKHLIKILLSSLAAGSNAILIDEPELSLHLDWQTVFVSTIRSLNPGCQLILASHSPEVMAEVSDDRIFKL